RAVHAARWLGPRRARRALRHRARADPGRLRPTLPALPQPTSAADVASGSAFPRGPGVEVREHGLDVRALTFRTAGVRLFVLRDVLLPLEDCTTFVAVKLIGWHGGLLRR